MTGLEVVLIIWAVWLIIPALSAYLGRKIALILDEDETHDS